MFLKTVASVLFLVYALFLVAIFDFKKCFSKRCFVTFLFGAASFASIFIVQVPIQKLLGRSIFFYNLTAFYKAILYAAVAGFVQEFFKALAAFYHKGNSFSGAVAGSGFGFTEVVFVLSSASLVSSVGVLERVFTLMFHISSTELVMYGKSKGKFIIFYIAVSLVHTAVDTFAVLFQMHYITLSFTEIFVAIVSTSLFITSLLLYRRNLKKLHFVPGTKLKN